ncbi:MAG: tripartite tricarboxylate transporter substrate binding protein [Proteobacteria bacterium]|nr:tripartite tricarboxylate transporter substrate binding protein [Pseudomonadota bacterium]
MRALGKAVLLFIGCFCAVGVQAQPFPNRPVTLIVPVPPGGILDYVARLVAPPLAKILAQSVVVENKSGASGNIAATFVARAKPDGYTLLVGYSMFHVGNPTLFSQLQWDPLRDFAPVAMLAVSPHLVAVHPSLPVNNLQELVAYARANPGKVNYGTPGNGSVPHVGVELFKQIAKINLTQVPYKGSGPMMLDVISGQVQMTVATPPSVMSHIQAGKLRGLAIAAKTRSPLLPDVPTSAESGYPGFELEAWVALFAPAGTPPEAVKRLTDALKQVLDTEEIRKATSNSGIEARYMPPAQLDQVVRIDLEYWSKVIREAKISAD